MENNGRIKDDGHRLLAIYVCRWTAILLCHSIHNSPIFTSYPSIYMPAAQSEGAAIHSIWLYINLAERSCKIRRHRIRDLYARRVNP